MKCLVESINLVVDSGSLYTYWLISEHVDRQKSSSGGGCRSKLWYGITVKRRPMIGTLEEGRQIEQQVLNRSMWLN